MKNKGTKHWKHCNKGSPTEALIIFSRAETAAVLTDEKSSKLTLIHDTSLYATLEVFFHIWALLYTVFPTTVTQTEIRNRIATIILAFINFVFKRVCLVLLYMVQYRSSSLLSLLRLLKTSSKRTVNRVINYSKASFNFGEFNWLSLYLLSNFWC